MSQYITDSKIIDGHLELSNIPFSNDLEVKVIVIPKIDLEKMSFRKVRELTKEITGNLADDVIKERNGE